MRMVNRIPLLRPQRMVSVMFWQHAHKQKPHYSIYKRVNIESYISIPEIKLRLENERLIVELAKLKRLFEYSEDGGAVGGAVELTLSDSNSLDAHSTDGSSSRIERLEMELKMAKEHIQRKCLSGFYL